MRLATSLCVLSIVSVAAGAFGCAADSRPNVASQVATLGPDAPSGGVDKSNVRACGAPPATGMPMKPKLPFEAVVTKAAKSPLPISGGTLAVLADTTTAVVSDPDRDRVYVVDLAANRVSATIALQPGDEPGRLAQDAAGRVHVALRHGGALVSIDPKAGAVLARRDACVAPRGLAYEAAGDLVHVACASGELVSFPAAGGDATRTLTIERDLRDVVVGQGGQLYLSTFRKADVLLVGADGAIKTRLHAGSGAGPGSDKSVSPAVAWRMLPRSRGQGGVLLLHQTGVDSFVSPTPGGYEGPVAGCGGIVASAVSVLSTEVSSEPVPGAGLGGVTLAVDVAISTDGRQIAVAAPGNSAIANGPSVIVGSSFNATQSHNCGPVGAPPPGAPAGEVVSVSFVGDTSTVLAQVREPAGLWRSDTQQTIPLATDSFADTGHALFHADAGSGIACASCHPEGGDDGRVWNFTCMGARRTQSLRGGIMGTAPFHWDGVENDFARLTEDVFEGRMSGPLLNVEQKTAMQAWIDTIPALPARRGLDAAAVERGHALFDDKKVGCATCHAGALLTNNQTVDIGIGPATQVPSLRGITWRAPFMHTGCARSLVDRFDPACGGRADRHGATSSLSPGQLGDLVMYLESL